MPQQSTNNNVIPFDDTPSAFTNAVYYSTVYYLEHNVAQTHRNNKCNSLGP